MNRVNTIETHHNEADEGPFVLVDLRRCYARVPEGVTGAPPEAKHRQVSQFFVKEGLWHFNRTTTIILRARHQYQPRLFNPL